MPLTHDIALPTMDENRAVLVRELDALHGQAVTYFHPAPQASHPDWSEPPFMHPLGEDAFTNYERGQATQAQVQEAIDDYLQRWPTMGLTGVTEAFDCHERYPELVDDGLPVLDNEMIREFATVDDADLVARFARGR